MTIHTVYFAYGSNMDIAQMAQRCPEIRYLGFAILQGYCWLINQRGYANIVPDSTSDIEGLCFLINPSDEAILDQKEGVQFNTYEKFYYNVEIMPQPVGLVGRDVVQINAQTRYAADGGWYAAGRDTVHAWEQGRRYGDTILALVYIGMNHTQSGPPRRKYHQTMTQAIADARTLGMSERYEVKSMGPYLDMRDRYEDYEH